MNIFEGGRRIRTVIALGAPIGFFLFGCIFLKGDFDISAQELKVLIIASLIWAAIVHVLSFAIGWIVRGFLGIPSGKDRADETS